MKALQSRLKLKLVLRFETAFRIGSGRPGATMSDHAVVTDYLGRPFVPGSSLKGRLRATAERLAPHLGLTACLLDSKLSGQHCCSCQTWYAENKSCIDEVLACADTTTRLHRIDCLICDVCKLFGSPVMAGRLFVSDGSLTDWADVIEVRDGVAIDRDSETAVPNRKFDYETIPAETHCMFSIDVDNPTENDKALLGAVLLEWTEGFTLGGSTSRGLGRAKIESAEAWHVDLSDSQQRASYLTKRQMVPIPSWAEYFQRSIAARTTAS